LQLYLIGGKPVERLMLADGCLNTARCEHRKISGQWPGGQQNQEESAPGRGWCRPCRWL